MIGEMKKGITKKVMIIAMGDYNVETIDDYGDIFRKVEGSAGASHRFSQLCGMAEELGVYAANSVHFVGHSYIGWKHDEAANPNDVNCAADPRFRKRTKDYLMVDEHMTVSELQELQRSTHLCL